MSQWCRSGAQTGGRSRSACAILDQLHWATIRQPRHLELPAPPAGSPGPFRLSAAGALEQALAEAGFTGIATQPIATSFAWSSAEEFTRFQRSVAAPVHGMLEGQSAELRAEVWKAVTRAADDRAGRDGAVRLEAELVLVAGEGPAN